MHTIGGLSAHGDQADLMSWYGAFKNKPPIYLVHGESRAQEKLAAKMRNELRAPVSIAERGQRVDISAHVGKS